MAQVLMVSFGTMIDLAFITANANAILEGFFGSDRDGNPLEGLMRNWSARPDVRWAENNNTPVIIGDAVYEATNTDGVARFAVRINGKEGYFTSNTLVGFSLSSLGLVNSTNLVLEGSRFSSNLGINKAGTMPNRGNAVSVPLNYDQVYAWGYYNTFTVKAVTNLIASNVKKGVVVGNVTGTWEGYTKYPYIQLFNNGVNTAGVSFGTTSGVYTSVKADRFNITASSNTNSAELVTGWKFDGKRFEGMKLIIEGLITLTQNNVGISVYMHQKTNSYLFGKYTPAGGTINNPKVEIPLTVPDMCPIGVDSWFRVVFTGVGYENEGTTQISKMNISP